MTPVALTIAGSDPSGGAGLQADLKTFHQYGVYGMSAVTLVTVQSTRGVTAVETLGASLVRSQLEAVVADIPPAAAKTGALGSAATITTVAEAAARFTFPLVVDPVMISKHGDPLLPGSAMLALREQLVPRAYLVTPNLHEASVLVGRSLETPAEVTAAARDIVALGAANVLIKGGVAGDKAVDVLVADGEIIELTAPRSDSRNLHGTGCVLSAAITAGLARGLDLPAAVALAKDFVTAAIESGPALGEGVRPVNMFAAARVE